MPPNATANMLIITRGNTAKEINSIFETQLAQPRYKINEELKNRTIVMHCADGSFVGDRAVNGPTRKVTL